MQDIEIDFYSGFEDDEEIHFFIKTELSTRKIKMWIGYFRTILRSIKTPSDIPWTGLAHYNNFHLGWHEESNWQIPDLEEVLFQLQHIELPVDDPMNHMDYSPQREILVEMISIISEGIEKNLPVYINQCFG